MTMLIIPDITFSNLVATLLAIALASSGYMIATSRKLAPLRKSVALLAIAAFGLILHNPIGLLTYTTAQPRGSSDYLPLFLLALYLSSVAGMLSRYVFVILLKPPQERPPVDIQNAIAPLFVSPMTFLPVINLINDLCTPFEADFGARIMYLSLAFQSGFLWHAFFLPGSHPAGHH